jgi:hypothetical protein
MQRVLIRSSWLCSIAAAGALGGCQPSTDLGGAAFLCTDEPICPDRFQCVDGRCVAEGSTSIDASTDGGGVDGGAGAFGFRQKLTFENRNGGDLADFPVMVALDAGRIDYKALRADGRDLVFLDADGAPLAHEIERWNPEGTSIVWVRVPLIDARSDADFIWMVYGDPDAEVLDDPAAWSAYEAVYHLDDGDAVGDSTARGYDGGSIGGQGAIGFLDRGGGRLLDGVGEYVDLGTERDFARAALGVTIEAWVKPSAAQQGVIFGASVNAGPATSRAELRLEADQTLRGGARTDELGDLQSVVSTQVLSLDTWSWVAVVCDLAAAEVTIYIDGMAAGSAAGLAFDLSTADTPSAQASIGVNETLDSQFFPGAIDEVRLAPTALGPDWIVAQSASMRDELVTYGPAEML